MALTKQQREMVKNDLMRNLPKIVELYDQVPSFIQELDEVIDGLPEVDKQEVAGLINSWAQWYEKPILETAKQLFSIGNAVQLLQSASIETPYSDLLSISEQLEVPEATDRSTAIKLFAGIYAPLKATKYNLDCISYYSQPISELVKVGTRESLLKAVSIDSTASICAPYNSILSTAQSSGDMAFLDQFSSALKGPTQKRDKNRITRFFSCLIDDAFEAMGAKLTESEAANILIDALGLFDTPDDPGGTLKRNRHNWRQEVKETKG
jgi:hypothetical protein